MNIRNNKGITLLSLVLTVIVLIILTYAGVQVSMGITSVVKFQNMETNLMTIKSKCESLSNDIAIGEKDENALYGVKQTEGKFTGWYKLRQNELIDLGLTKAHEEDGYYVRYNIDEDVDNVDVIYEKGIANDGVVYYKLSDIIAAGMTGE